MSSDARDSFQLSAIIGHELVETSPVTAAACLSMLASGEIWGEA